MTWLAWRQHRRQLLFGLIGLALLAAVLVPTGLPVHRAFGDSGLARCLDAMSPIADYRLSDPATGLPDCHEPAERFSAEHDGSGYLAVGLLLIFLPLLVGLFFGAPLVAREVEHGTHRLVWTQGITRRRWVMTKVGVVGAGALAIATGYAVLVTWWLYPTLVANAGRFEYLAFDLQGFAPVGYTLFAVALGVFAGTVWRKVRSAMAITLFGFVGVRLAVALARPHFLPPLERRYPVMSETFPNPMLSEWILDRNAYDSAGRVIAPGGDIHCELSQCTDHSLGDYNVHLYQPADRFWLFQSIETGLFVALAIGLVALAVHRVRRRIS